MKNFNDLSEREILLWVIVLEEDDGVFADFAENLCQKFPSFASLVAVYTSGI